MLFNVFVTQLAHGIERLGRPTMSLTGQVKKALLVCIWWLFGCYTC